MSPYSVILSHKARDELNKLPSDLGDRIKKKLKSSEENPFHFFERLKGRMDYKLRVGDYRVIADIHEENKRIEVNKIGPRKNIYKELV